MGEFIYIICPYGLLTVLSNVPSQCSVMLRISFPFKLFEEGDRNCTSFEREMIANISFALREIRV